MCCHFYFTKIFKTWIQFSIPTPTVLATSFMKSLLMCLTALICLKGILHFPCVFLSKEPCCLNTALLGPDLGKGEGEGGGTEKNWLSGKSQGKVWGLIFPSIFRKYITSCDYSQENVQMHQRLFWKCMFLIHWDETFLKKSFKIKYKFLFQIKELLYVFLVQGLSKYNGNFRIRN